MKIAVTYENENVFQHFGQTKQFKVYSVEDGSIIKSEVLSAGETSHCAMGAMLELWGINKLICGGIGGGAKRAVAVAGIELYAGVTGNADVQVEALLKGLLDYNSDTECSHHHEHTHGGSCGH